jgi:putative sterol carrier protein
MNESKHTPGKWSVDGHIGKHNDVMICGGDVGGIVAFACDKTDGSDKEANARLIAAAPDLLAIAKSSLAHLEAWHTGEYEYEKDVIRAAIARAEGRA